MEFSSNHAIYPASKSTGYISFLIICKGLLSTTYYVSYKLLKTVHVVHFLFIAKAFSSIALILIQKPLSSGKPLSKSQWFRIIRHALINSILSLLMLFGLTQCGPLRTILLSEHNDLVVVAAVSAVFTGNGGNSKFRGGICLLIGILSLLFLDHDEREVLPTEHPEGQQHHGISHIFYFTISRFGLVDHKAGVILLVLLMCLQTGFNSASRILAVDIGGKRLNALSTLVSVALLAPFSFLLRLTQIEMVPSWSSFIIPFLFISLVWLVINFYADAMCATKLESLLAARIASLSCFILALVIGPYLSSYLTLDTNKRDFVEEHFVSGGVLFGWIMFILATIILTSPQSQSAKGKLVGYSSSGLPLYTFSGELIQKTSSSVALVIKNSLKQILKESDSRKIFYFLCVNLIFTFVEMLYGIWTNSLGLLSDSFHMLFDCSALVLGLCASIFAKKSPTRTFPFGFGRVEILSGFINGLFLIVISFLVFKEAAQRLLDPPEIITSKLLTVSVIGLCINLFGIMVFHHAHHHNHGSGSSHSHSHQHSHNANLQGVFLHIVADTLGSVGVIVSSILIEQFGWNRADPICSLFIAILIFLSVIPLLKHSSMILLLRVPPGMEKGVATCLNKIMKIEGVLSYRNQHFWTHASNVLVGSIHVQVMPNVSEQKIVNQVSAMFKEIGFTHVTVQAEKEAFFHHMSGLGNDLQNILRSSAMESMSANSTPLLIKTI